MIKLAKVNSVKYGRITDDKNIVLITNIIRIIANTSTNSISNRMKHIEIPKTTKYRLLKKKVM